MIPFLDLKKQHNSIKKDIDLAVGKVLDDSNFILGYEVDEFERNFAKYIGVKRCIGVSTGESAILLILKALGVGPGDEVVTVANTFIATVFPIITLGAKPILIDIDPKTYQMDLNMLRKSITPKTKVILPVHLFGIPAPMEEILKIVKEKNISVVEDACQAHGSSISGKMCGSFGIASAFSFYPGKNLGAAGDAGGITTNDEELANKLIALRNIGQFEKYKHDLFGYNFRIDTIQAAYLNVKLKHLDFWNKKRRNIANYYSKLLSDLPVVLPPKLKNGLVENYHLYVIKSEKRNELLEFLKQNEIATGIHYPIPLHLQKSLSFLGYNEGSFPITEKFADEILSLPMFPNMTKEQAKEVSTKIHEFYRNLDRLGKIVITGGAGFIGSSVVDYLLEHFAEKIDKIVVLDNFVRGKKENLIRALKNEKVELVVGDIRDKELVDKLIKGANYVIHEAAIKNILCDEDPRLSLEVLVNGTFNVMEACVKHKVRKLVFNSSASVYGQPLKIPMQETDNYNNEAFYGAGKIANEQMAKAFNKMYGLNYVCLRPFNIYGPRMDISGIYTEVFIRWLDSIDNGKAPVIFGDGTNTLDFVYIEDVVKATIAALLSDIKQGFYNVGSGDEVSLNKLVEVLLKCNKSDLKVEHIQQTRKSNYVTRRKADIVNAKKDLGFIATTSLETGVKKLIEWRKKIKKNEDTIN